jgi:transcriptional regulator with XRE-family HTH domain
MIKTVRWQMNYQENLRRIREERGISEEQIAELLGRSRQSYRNIEKGKSKLKIRDLITLAEFYGVTSDHLLGLDQESQSD